MLSSEDRLKVNENDVAAKVIDGEAIIINLSNGMYFSLDGAGAVMWALLAAGHSLAETSALVARHFQAERATVASDIRTLADQLVAEGLVRVDRARFTSVTPVVPEPVNGHGYEPPTLHKYTDMGDILALDPPLPVLKNVPESVD